MLVFAPSVAEPERLAGPSQGLSYLDWLLIEPDSLEPNSSPVFPVGGHCRVTFQSAHMKGVRLPESLQGVCSFGGRSFNPHRIATATLSPLMYRAVLS